MEGGREDLLRGTRAEEFAVAPGQDRGAEGEGGFARSHARIAAGQGPEIHERARRRALHLPLRRKGPDGQQPGRTRGQAVRHRQEELPLLQVRDGRRGVRDDDDRRPDGFEERAHSRTLPRVAFRELAEASDGTPHAVVRRRAGFLQGACQIAFLYGVSNALCEMPNKNIRCFLYREIIYRYQ